jgi:hypothetical protein
LANVVSQPSERIGRVVDAQGRPVPNAHVVIVRGSVPMPEIALLSDESGRFVLRLPEGVFTLRAHGPAGTGETEVEVDGGPAEDEIVITLSG